ncbi:MAG: dynamin family protein [archaeon]|nr:dynamin family protein [archaeon]
MAPLPYRFWLPEEAEALDRHELVERETALLQRVSGLLRQLEASKEDLKLAERTRKQLQELFLLVVLGEFNSGKSSFINGLLGGRFLEEGVTPTTAEITRIVHGEQYRVDSTLDDALQVQVPLGWLRQVNLVDTPGTNAIVENHERITRDFLPRCDFILFLTSCDRPLSSSETAFLQRIGDWKKKILIVVTKTDQTNPEDLNQITSFVRTNVHSLLHITSPVFPISSKRAHAVQQLALKSVTTPAHPSNASPNELQQEWQASGFPHLFQFLQQQLSCNERTRIKLESPLSITHVLLQRYAQTLEHRRGCLEKDTSVVTSLALQNRKYAEDMRAELPLQLNQVKIVLEAMKLRGSDFISTTFSIWNLASTLRNPNGFSASFQAEVLKNYAREIDQSVANIAEWITSNNSRRLKHAISTLGADSRFQIGQLVDEFDLSFRERRLSTIDRVTSAVRHVVDSDERARQSSSLLAAIKSSVYQTLAVEAGAASFAALFAASLLDISGVGIAAVLATAGFIWLPYKQKKVTEEFKAAVKSLSISVETSVSTHCESELGSALSSFEQAILPFSAFLETESQRIQSASEEMDAITTEVDSLRQAINSALSSSPISFVKSTTLDNQQ